MNNDDMNSHVFSLLPFNAESSRDLPIAITGTIALKNHQMNIRYRISGTLEKIHFPDVSSQATRRNKLWTSTCCEMFVGVSGDSRYWEYNLSPSHDWAVFSFTDYRANKSDELSISNLDIATKIDKDRQFELNTILALPDALTGHKLDVGISSVIQDTAGNFYYYALTHPGQQPDFHDRHGFTLQLGAEQ